MTRPGVTRRRVVETAARVIDGGGPESLTLARVAQELGIRTPSLYSHVDGIEELRRALALATIDDLAEACRTAAMGRAGADAVRAIADAYRALAGSRPGSYALTQVAHPGDTDWEEASHRVLQPILATLDGMGVQGTDAIHATRFVRSALHGFVTLEQGGGFGLDVSVDDSFRHLVDGLVAGIG